MKNSYRFFKKFLIILISLAFFLFSFTSLAHAEVNKASIISLTNQKRAENGLAPLTINYSLESSASTKANDMLANNYWSHNSPSGKTPWTFIRNAGYKYLFAGENLAEGYSSGEAIIAAWMASPSHRANILNRNYKEVGVAIISGNLKGKSTILVVEHFGSSSQTKAAKKIARK